MKGLSIPASRFAVHKIHFHVGQSEKRKRIWPETLEGGVGYCAKCARFVHLFFSLPVLKRKRGEQNGIGKFQHLHPLTPSSPYSFHPFFFLFLLLLPFSRSFFLTFFFFFFFLNIKYILLGSFLLSFLPIDISAPFFFFIGPFPSSSSETSRQTKGSKKEKS